MYVRQVSFAVQAELRRSFEAFWKSDYRTALAKQPGVVGAHLLRHQDESAEYQMLLMFSDESSSVAWKDSADHLHLRARFKELVPATRMSVLVSVD